MAPATAVGFAEPEVCGADKEADGLGDVPPDPPEDEVEVTTEFVELFEPEVPVVVAEGAIAERT